MIKKYLIRIIGALCILGAMAVLFMPGSIRLDGIKRRDLRIIRNDLRGQYAAGIDNTILFANQDESQDELRDCGFPHTKAKLKARSKEVTGMIDELLDGSVSMKELLIASCKAPGFLEEMQNLLESDYCSSVFFHGASYYALTEGSQANYRPGEHVESSKVTKHAEKFEKITQDAIDEASEYTFVFSLLAGFLILLIVLAAASAATHICNKGRWLKYVLLAILVILVIGLCVALPVVSDILAEQTDMAMALEDLTLEITAAPFIAVALLLVPMVLDIIFERKKKLAL